jgi:hypothetical protein
MNRLKIVVFAEPFSINKAYYLKSFKTGAPTKVRTKECREWGDRVLSQLESYKQKLLDFKAQFNEETHALRLELMFLIPRSHYFTKEGKISIRSCDLTNVEKLLVDVLCDDRFNDRMLNGNKIVNLGINDKYIIELLSEKKPSILDYEIQMTLTIIPNGLVA